MEKTEPSQHTFAYHTCPLYNDIMLIGMDEQQVASVRHALKKMRVNMMKVQKTDWKF